MKERTNTVFLHSFPSFAKAALAGLAMVLCFSIQQAQADITWGTATTIAGDTDVLNVGSPNYAYGALLAAPLTINGVTFGQMSTRADWGSGNVTTTFTSGPTDLTDPSGLSVSYTDTIDAILWMNPYATATVTLGNLTLNHVYATQVWEQDGRPNKTYTMTLTSGANSVVLDVNTSNASGGKGQYVIGGFTASGTTQPFTVLGSDTSTQLNAAQVRDVTGVWSGSASGTWDDTSANFTGGNSWTTASGLIGASGNVYFADTDGFKNAVVNNTVSIQDAGISTGTIVFQNNSVNYTINNVSGTTGITGSTAIITTGTGIVTIAGTNTYTGSTTISNGTLKVNGSLSSGNVNVATNGVLSGVGLLTNAIVTVEGTLAPGDSDSTPGVMQIHSNLVLSASAKLTYDYNAASADVVAVSGQLTLGASCAVTLNAIDGATPPDRITLFTGSSLSGTENLASWTVTGPDPEIYPSEIRCGGNSVYVFFRERGTVISIH